MRAADVARGARPDRGRPRGIVCRRRRGGGPLGVVGRGQRDRRGCPGRGGLGARRLHAVAPRARGRSGAGARAASPDGSPARADSDRPRAARHRRPLGQRHADRRPRRARGAARQPGRGRRRARARRDDRGPEPGGAAAAARTDADPRRRHRAASPAVARRPRRAHRGVPGCRPPGALGGQGSTPPAARWRRALGLPHRPGGAHERPQAHATQPRRGHAGLRQLAPRSGGHRRRRIERRRRGARPRDRRDAGTRRAARRRARDRPSRGGGFRVRARLPLGAGA